MSFRSITLPVQLGRDTDPFILGARMAVADVIRTEARAMLTRGQSAGVDAVTLGQRMVMSYTGAMRQSRFLRGFPGPVARWCFQVEQDAPNLASESYPAAQPNCVGNYGPGWLTPMPNRVIVINAGGVRATGVLAEDDALVLHEVRETRLYKTLGNDGSPAYACQIIMSSDSGNRFDADVPADPERELQPEDM